jgi:glutathione S-transferase
MTSLVVHHLEHSRSQRVLWLLEELGVPYELRLYRRDARTRRARPRTATTGFGCTLPKAR